MMDANRGSSSLLLLAPLLLLASSAHASDGVLEISQTCALNTGCFSGDAPGFPVAIDGNAGRSYRLTSDLVLPNENSTGIYVSTHDVAIDLAGFTIIGQACVGAVANCMPGSGLGYGVVMNFVNRRGISVRNGSVVGMGAIGVWVGEQGEVHRVRARWNRLGGIKADAGSTVSDSLAFENQSSGIDVGNGSTVSRNTAFDNAGYGIWALEGVTVSGNTLYGNGGGIYAEAGSSVQGNSVRSNNGYGLFLDPYAAYRGNTINGNSNGDAAGGVNMGGNLCGPAICP